MPGPGGGGINSLIDLMQPAQVGRTPLDPGVQQGYMQLLGGGGGGGGMLAGAGGLNPLGFAQAMRGTPGAFSLNPQDRQNPLAYSAHDYQPRDTGGYFTLADLYDSAPGGANNPMMGAPGAPLGPGGQPATRAIGAPPGGNVPHNMQEGANLPSTNNWQLLPPPYNTPQYLMRNGRIIDLLQSQIDTGQKNVMGAETQADRNRPGYSVFGRSPFVQSWSFGGAASGWPGQPGGWSQFSTDVS